MFSLKLTLDIIRLWLETVLKPSVGQVIYIIAKPHASCQLILFMF